VKRTIGRPAGVATRVARNRSSTRRRLRLLDDVGWEEDDERELFKLTLPDEQLERAMRALLQHSEDLLHDHDRELRGEGPLSGLERKLRAEGADL
jgi:hypothetical protein